MLLLPEALLDIRIPGQAQILFRLQPKIFQVYRWDHIL